MKFLLKKDGYFMLLCADHAELPPKTYITKERLDYFKPCIQVEMDHPDKLDSVTEVYIRGAYLSFTLYRNNMRIHCVPKNVQGLTCCSLAKT